MRDAEARTGLSDWGADTFRKPFELLIADLNTHAALTEIGVKRAHRRLSDTLAARLELVADRKKFAGLAEETIEQPIFVIGLPRSGTTFFHNLLTADPANRSPMTWEIMYPSPPPQAQSYHSDPRIEKAREAMRFEGFMEEELQSIHPFEAERPEECNFLWELSFTTVNYSAWWNIPNYNAHLYAMDFTPVYEEEKRVLQHLQHRLRGDRWVLKTPAHHAWMDDLLSVFPDALFVQCHRDPAKIIPSLSNNLAVWRKTFSDLPPQGDFGMLEQQARMLKNVARIRALPGMEARFFDAHFLDVQKDPIALFEDCYRHFGIEVTPERVAAVRDWMEADRSDHAKGPKHKYALSDIGMDYAQIDAAMGEYIEQSGVQLER